MNFSEKPPSRVIIDKVLPQIDGGRFAAKRYLDKPVEVIAVLLVDGHDHIKARLLYRHQDESEFSICALTTNDKDRGNDRWRASFKPEKLGKYFVTVEACIDRFDTWKSDIQKKLAAGQRIEVDLMIGVNLLESRLTVVPASEIHYLEAAALNLRNWASNTTALTKSDLISILEEPGLTHAIENIFEDISLVRYEREVPIQIEPALARFSSWYEFFPRSVASPTTSDKLTHGSFRDSEERLEYIKDLGFNIVYLPPIHPIGHAFRKGKNNSLEPDPHDVGSPWAIGSKHGGHKDILPELGSLRDFKNFLKRANELNLQVALDLAFQCSPDHPYVKEHPEWFKKRPDGSIQYAENPPKKYQDIYPFDFESSDWRGLWEELKSVIQYWVDQGVKIFRVDNPHTKSFAFWEWVIAEVRVKDPEVLFLAEAFTRPQVMAYLAKIGFNQSYTYFTWRNTKWELTQYLTELTQTEWADYFVPNFWPNTPDILPPALQTASRNTYLQRLTLAATLSSNYGLYGPAFELMEHKAFRSGGEEYLNSEKYEVKQWDLGHKDSLAPFLKKINQIRNTHKALQQNRGLRFHWVSNEALIAYSKSLQEETILVVVNLDSENVQSGQVELPLIEWNLDESKVFELEDLLTGNKYFWSGWRNYVEFRPQGLPAHIFKVKTLC